MATLNGRNARVTVNASTTEALVAEMADWQIDTSADEIDTAAFGDGWGKSDVGMLKWSGSANGFYDPGDTAGQEVLQDAFLAGTLLQDIRFYARYATGSGEQIVYIEPDTSADPNAGVRITSVKIGASKSGVASLAFTFSGSGPYRRVEETIP